MSKKIRSKTKLYTILERHSIVTAFGSNCVDISLLSDEEDLVSVNRNFSGADVKQDISMMGALRKGIQPERFNRKLDVSGLTDSPAGQTDYTLFAYSS